MSLYDECPAIHELRATLSVVCPSVHLGTIVRVYPGTRHTSGIAMDIMLNMREPREYAIANALIAALTDTGVYAAMRWSDLIYSAWVGTPGGTINHYHIPGRERHGYGGTPLRPNNYTADRDHENHIHIDWVDFGRKNPQPEYLTNPYQWTDSARATGFSATLRAAITRSLASPAPPTAGATTP